MQIDEEYDPLSPEKKSWNSKLNQLNYKSSTGLVKEVDMIEDQ
jgi:hypothetical protein